MLRVKWSAASGTNLAPCYKNPDTLGQDFAVSPVAPLAYHLIILSSQQLSQRLAFLPVLE